jgi:flagellar basal body-associated protein FliL
MAEEKKGGGGSMVLGIVVPAIVAGAAAFGGAKFAAGANHAPKAAPSHHEAEPPGPTLALEPFVVTINDGAKKPHAMKVTIAIECKAKAKEEALKVMVPRIRDAALSYLRTMTFERATEEGLDDKAREELLERFRKAGVVEAERVLLTDYVVQ